jgi:DNA-binding transcriptional LysR family regulator
MSGHPRTAKDEAQLSFVGSDRSGLFLSYLQQHGLPLSEANFSCYADHSAAHLSLVCEGMGIGAMMDKIALDTPRIVRVLNEVRSIQFPIWLVTHRELRTSRRIRKVFEARGKSMQ